MTAHTSVVTDLVFSDPAQLLASASEDHTIRLWRPDGAPVRVLRGHTDFVTQIRFSPDGARLVSGSEDSTARLWDPLTGKGEVPRRARRTGDAVSLPG